MSNVYRAYIPTVKWARQAAQRVALSALVTPLAPVTVDSRLVHRKVWAWLWSISATWSAEYDLVATLNGSEVYRQKLAKWDTGGGFDKWFSGFAQVGAQTGTVNEQVFTFIGNSTLFCAVPWRLNLACDTFFIDVRAASGAAAAFDYAIFVQSQQGI